MDTCCRTDYSHFAGKVVCVGYVLLENEEFDSFIRNDVTKRLYDPEVTDAFKKHLNGLHSLGVSSSAIKAVLDSFPREERSWAIGEAIAEAFLNDRYDVCFPWNTSRDSRSPNASLPGADIVGIIKCDDTCRFAFGEVKTSSEDSCPPQVMYGRSGMTHQLENLSQNLSIVTQLMIWLFPRVQETEYFSVFKEALETLVKSDNRDMALFGVLIRDTAPNSKDLLSRGHALSASIKAPEKCNLIALYMPIEIDELHKKINQVAGHS